jgi:hypothetical protein
MSPLAIKFKYQKEFIKKMKKIHETIIIGAGISGLACARKLHENKRKFLVISEDIAGKILASENGKVNYGAQYVAVHYHHVKEIVKIKRRLSRKLIDYHKKNQSYTLSLWNKRFLITFFQAIKFALLLINFRKHYEAFKKKCENISQAEALRSDPYLFELYNNKATDFIREKRIKQFIEYFMAPFLHSCLCPLISKLNAFSLLLFSMPLVFRIYEFSLQKDKIKRILQRKIILDTVTQIKKEGDMYLVKTKKKTYSAKNIVVATPPHVSKKLLQLKKIKKSNSAHMIHVSGELREKWKFREFNFFPETNPLRVIGHQVDGSYLVCSKNRNPNFKNYFQRYQIIYHKFWDPVFHMEGTVLWECEQDKNLYLIGDHNFPSLEDSYITGLYAANRILGKAK